MSRLETASSAEAEPFWEASRERRLVLPWCTSCNRPHWFPRAICPHCGGRTFDWREASGRVKLLGVIRVDPGVGRAHREIGPGRQRRRVGDPPGEVMADWMDCTGRAGLSQDTGLPTFPRGGLAKPAAEQRRLGGESRSMG